MHDAGGRSIVPYHSMSSAKECPNIPLVVQIWGRTDVTTKILLTSARQNRTSIWTPDMSSFSYCTDPVSYKLDFSS
jgi:hypothetical protein